MFQNRIDAGKKLFTQIKSLINNNTLIYAVPRGGIIIAGEICKETKKQMNTIVAKKLRFPYNDEIAIGAVVEDGLYVLNEEAVAYSNISDEYIKDELRQQIIRIDKLRERLKSARRFDVYDKRVIVIDDGLATGMTMLAIVRYLQLHRANEIIVCVPVASREAAYILENNGARVISNEIPNVFEAVGSYYEDFTQVSYESAADTLTKYN
ncbi:MAG: phosphoribosyltransferase [Bacillota bacterium]